MNKKAMIGQIVGVLIMRAVAIILFPIIQKEINDAIAMGNITQSNSTIMQTFPLLFALIVLIIGVIISYIALKDMGTLGGEDYDEDDNDNYGGEEDDDDEDYPKISIEREAPEWKVSEQEAPEQEAPERAPEQEAPEQEVPEPIFKENKNFESKSKFD